MRKNSHIS